MLRRPVEERSLRVDGSMMFRGSLRLWVDVLTREEADANPLLDITKPLPVPFELRVVIWQVRTSSQAKGQGPRAAMVGWGPHARASQGARVAHCH